MKKLLLSLAGMALAFAANADRYWIHGQIFGDSGWGSVELTLNKTTGKYEKIGKLEPGDFGVKVTDDGGVNQLKWWSAPNNAKNISQAGTYPIQDQNNTNYSSTLEGNYTISLDWDSKKLTFEPYSGEIIEGAPTYALKGNCFGGAWESKEMTESNGIWTWTGSVYTGENNELGIQRLIDGVQKGWYWGDPQGTEISDNGTYQLILQEASNGKNLSVKINGEYTFTFDPETLKLKVEGESVAPDPYKAIYFMGTRNGFKETPEGKMLTEDGKVYTLNLPDANSDYEFKFKIGDKWFSNGEQEMGNGTYTISDNDETNMSLATGGDVTFTVEPNSDYTSIKLTISGQEEDPEGFAPIFLVGEFSNWTTDDEYKLATTDGKTYTITVPDMSGDANFKFFGNDGHKHWFSNGRQNLPDGTYTLGIDSSTGDMSLLGGGDVTFTFVLNENHGSASLTIAGQKEVTPDEFPEMYLTSKRYNWGARDKLKMQTEDGVTYTLTVPDMSTQPFKFFGGDWGVRELTGAGNALENGEYTLRPGSDNMTLGIGGNVTFTLVQENDFASATLTIEGQQGEVVRNISYALHGQFKSETWETIAMTAVADQEGVYTATFTPTFANGQFGVQMNVNGNQEDWYNEAVTFNAENPSHKLTLEAETTAGVNCEFGFPVNVKYIATFNANTLELSFKADGDSPIVDPVEPEYTYNVFGGVFGTSNWEVKAMTLKDKVYVLENQVVESGEFIIRRDTQKENGEAYFKAPEAGMTITTAEGMTLSKDEGANINIKKGKYTFTFNPESLLLSIEGEEIPENDPVYIYQLHTDVVGGEWDDIDLSEENGKWSATLQTVEGTVTIKKVDTANGNATVWIKAKDEQNAIIEPDKTLEAAVEGVDWSSDLTGKYTFTFDPVAMTLVVTGEADDPIIDPVEEKYYLVGSFGWTADEAYRFTKGENDEYTLDLEGEFTSVFKINNGTWEVQFGSNGLDVVLGEEYECSNDGNSGNLSFGENKGVMNPHFVLNPETNILVVTGELLDLTPSYVISGSIFGDPKWSTEDLTEVNGKWVLNETKVEAGEFIIIKVQGADKTPVEWIKADGEETVTVTLGQAMPAISEGANWSIENDGTYAFTFDPVAMTLVVTGEADDPIIDPVEEKYYLVGSFGWTADEAYRFTKGENGEYTLDLEGEFTSVFKINNGTWEVQFGSNGLDVVLGEEYECSNDGNSGNLSFGENKGVMNPHFVLNPETNILVVTGELIDLTPSYVISGSIFGDPNWSTEDMTEVDGKWILTDVEIEKGEFIIIKVQGADKTPVEWIKSAGTPEEGSQAVEVNVGKIMPTVAEGSNWSIKDFGKITFTFDPEANTLLLNWTSGINGIDSEEGEAVYFNLQGQRVAHPDKGIYIRVVNGKTQKVVK